MTKYAENQVTKNAKRLYEQAKNAPQVRWRRSIGDDEGQGDTDEEELEMGNLGAHIIEHDDDGAGRRNGFSRPVRPKPTSARASREPTRPKP